ncbi:HlyC/CorC family transporter [candidate division WOR-3 bacterium]|nr:HlyC/CorC family transporter [candidate division WOR-3 bacterium]
MSYTWYLAAMAPLLALSAAFSGAETALFSLGPARRERLRESDPRLAQTVDRLLSRPARLLGTILLANLLVNVSASALFTLAIVNWTAATGRSPAVYIGLGGLALTGLLLVFGEVTPKVLATHGPERYARMTAPLVRLAGFVLRPFSFLLQRLGAAWARRRGEDEHLSGEELQTMIRVGRERGVITEREQEILWNLVGLDERTVSEVMTPRIDIVGLEKGTPVRRAVQVCREEGRSRLPVYDGSVDSVIGVVYAKELLAADPDAPVAGLVRPAFFVPESKRLPSLLDELRKKGCHIAVVVDEFGQTAGLVTLEDALEAIFGEIADEYDDAVEETPWVKVGEGSYLVDGEIDIATLDRLFDGVFGDVEEERLAGFVLEQLGRLPEPGDTVRIDGVEVVVREVAQNALEKALVRRAPAATRKRRRR